MTSPLYCACPTSGLQALSGFHKVNQTMNDLSQISPEHRLIEEANTFGVSLTEPQAIQMLVYLKAVLAENQFINVTSIRDFDQALTHHLLDSLSVVQVWREISPETVPNRILDLGTGGGFPAIPLAIAWPESSVTAIDGTGKKIALVQRCLEATGITNVETIQARGADLPRQEPKRRKTFDLAVARAVGTAEKLVREVAGLVKSGGKIFLMKGPEPPDAEILAARKLMGALGLENYRLVHTQVPGLERRSVLTFTKK